MPEAIRRNPKVDAETASNLLTAHRELKVAQGVERYASEAIALDRAVRVEPSLARGATVLKATAIGAGVMDSYTTGRKAARSLEQDNLTDAQLRVVHFAGRNVGISTFATAGSAAGGALGGPLAW